MLTEQEIESAHSDAFDFAFGNLPAARRAEFNRHLSSCPHCRKVVDEYSQIGRIVKVLPPHVEPPADLEDRAVAAMVAAMAEQRARAASGTDAEDEIITRIYPVPRRQPPAEPETRAEPRAGATITRLPGWRRDPRRLVAVVAAVAAIVAAAIVIPLSFGGGRITPAQARVVIPLHVTAKGKASGYGSATGQATARQDASGSWNITLSVSHLRYFGDTKWYQCWYLSRDRHKVASAGTFLVPDNGSGTFSMTSAVDPHDFPTMEITISPPSKDGALGGTIILSGQPR
jgi:anti-sigma factor RsiW